MSQNETTLHARLVERQSDEELKRKAKKAARRGYWVREQLDYAEIVGRRLAKFFEGAPRE